MLILGHVSLKQSGFGRRSAGGAKNVAGHSGGLPCRMNGSRVDNQRWASCRLRQLSRTLVAMVAEHVELALFEQSLGNIEGLNRPFCDG